MKAVRSADGFLLSKANSQSVEQTKETLMQAIEIVQPGGPEVLKPAERPMPVL